MMKQLEEEDIKDAFLEECLYSLTEVSKPEISWFANFANYLATTILPEGLFH